MAPNFRRECLGAAAAALTVVLFCLHLLHGNPDVFFNDDYQISILPVFADMARSWSEGHWPLLSPYSWACGNLAGEYQYGTFSVFVNTVVVVVWKFSLTFAQRAAALSITHLAVLAAGSYLLARVRELPVSLAVGVALIASLNGWEMGWGATDWFGSLAAHAWLPWCWWAFEVTLKRTPQTNFRVQIGSLLPVPFVYLLLTGGFPYTVVMLGLVTVWLVVRTWSERGDQPLRLWPLATGWGWGLLLAAPAWLSLLEAMHGSGRSQHGVGTGNLAWTVPVTSLPGLILPNWTTPWPDFANVPCVHSALELGGGFMPMVGLLAGVFCLGRGALRAMKWELLLLGTILLLCLLPSPGLFRWSFRWLPLLHLVLALTGARALQLLANSPLGQSAPRNPGLWAAGIVSISWLAMRLAGTASPDPLTGNIAPWLLGVAALWAILEALPIPTHWRSWATIAAVAGSLGVLYRFEPTNTGLPVYVVGNDLARIAPLSPDRLYLGFYREPDRFYRNWQVPPGFGPVVRMGSMGMYAGVRMINGYSPIMAKGVGQEFSIETHGNVPEANGERLLRHEAGPDGLLDRLGVDGMIVTHDYQTSARPPAETWEMVDTFDEGDIYQRRAGRLSPVRSWTSAAPGAPDRFVPVQIEIVENSRQCVEAKVKMPGDAGGPGLIAFSRPFYPGYRATLNGKNLPVGSFRGLLPIVEIPAGSVGRLVLTYAPRALVYGWWLVGIAMVGMAISVGRPRLTKG